MSHYTLPFWEVSDAIRQLGGGARAILRSPEVQAGSYHFIWFTIPVVALFCAIMFFYMMGLRPSSHPQKGWTWFMGSFALLAGRYTLQHFYHDTYVVLGAVCWASLLGACVYTSVFYFTPRGRYGVES